MAWWRKTEKKSPEKEVTKPTRIKIRTAEDGGIKSCQAYVVIGNLASVIAGDALEPTDAEWQRVLDYFANSDEVDEEFPRWPRETIVAKEPETAD